MENFNAPLKTMLFLSAFIVLFLVAAQFVFFISPSSPTPNTKLKCGRNQTETVATVSYDVHTYPDHGRVALGVYIASRRVFSTAVFICGSAKDYFLMDTKAVVN